MTKICLIATEFPPRVGGMEALAAGLATALAQQVEVSVLTLAEHVEHPYDFDFPIYPQLTRRLKTDTNTIRQHHADAYLSLNAGYAPVALHLDKPFYSYCHGNDFLNVWVNSLTSFEDQVVDGLGSTPFFWRYRFPLRRRLLRLRVGRGLRHNAAVFVNSSHTRTRLKATFPKLDRAIYVVPPGLSETYFSQRSVVQSMHSEGGEGPLRLLTVARLAGYARRKNIDGVLRALASLRDELDFFYTVIGDGDLRRELEALAFDLGIRDRVTFLGWVSEEEKLRILDQTDLFVMCSKASATDTEGFGIVYIEAAARGVPSLASRNGGAVDAVAENVSGRFVEHGDPDEIAAEIRFVSTHPSSFNQMRVHEHAEQFKWVRISEKVLCIIKGRPSDTK
jgi:phosphatidylinositol alpha-1,6-mannosyltransferase